ncbi:TRAP transporter substrate-binding protein DctP [Anaerobacillus isosaccharinicus]|uniref:C4-dicarboxylate ABC transporter substrate-binding protein n=1 Tax=Anaerobacillus isosaccharinicus TaxID=1532552 RepID=A0A1S2M9J9_9BACI|nr:TRAP transporter substrate-binding protein [Anaerobacillus isosaccharinicus]MBA5587198.1 TRAP transporter substrate-binding protein [Anaerobacillus isosaccharinicus]QOY34606.1 TRAP transporter substrate-binding protein [Anaerobacillus isosaccharinicus]
MKKISLLIVFMSLLIVAACGNEGVSQQDNVNDQNGANSEKKIELTYAFFAPANTFPAVQMEKWAEELEARTNGRVKVNTFPGGSLLTAENMYQGVANGIADIGLSSTTYEPGRFPLLAIADMPSGYPNATVASKVLHQLVSEYPPEAFNNFKIITTFATEPSFIQSQLPISNLNELKGKQLRIAGAATPIMEKLGAAPVGMSQAEVPEALQTGIVNGFVSSREVLQDLKLAEMVSYITDYPLTINTFVAVMNQDVWNSLPKDVQQVIDELNAEMATFTGEYLDNHVKNSIKWSQQEHGVEVITLTESEKETWDKILREMQEDYVNSLEAQGLPGKEFQEKLYELISQFN